VLSNDPVAADALAASYFDIPMERVAFIHLAEKAGLGSADVTRLKNTKVAI